MANSDDFVRMNHGKDFEKFVKEVLPTGQVVYTYDNGTVTYIHKFTAL